MSVEFLHAMVRVGDLPAALKFFIEGLGLVEVRRNHYPQGKYTQVFLASPEDMKRIGYEGKERMPSGLPMVELTHNWGHEPYEMGSGFGHLAVGVPDVTGMCAEVTKAGGKVTRAPGPVKFGTTVIAFVEDPDGYKIELIERK